MKRESKSPALLTREYILSQFSHIFNGSIILDRQFQIVCISNRTAALLKYSVDELTGKPIGVLFNELDFQGRVQQLLDDGFFCDERFELKDFDDRSIYVRLSGFYLGLLSDFDEFIVISIQDVNTEYRLATQRQTYASTMEHLVYRAAHDLRGPIATILGLVHVGKLRRDNEEIDQLLNSIDIFGKKLENSLKEFLEQMRENFGGQ